MNPQGMAQNNTNGTMPTDVQFQAMHQLSRENTAAWVQGQNSQMPNLPQPQAQGVGLPHLTPTQGMPMPQNNNSSNVPPHKNWNMMNNNNMASGGMSNMHVNPEMNNMMHSPIPPNVQVPHPPTTPKSGKNVPIHGHVGKIGQGPMMPNLLMQGQGHLPHPPVNKVERASPQVQVPHISQSQIPPRAKAANRNQIMEQQQQQQQQQMMQNNPMVNMQQGNLYANKMFNNWQGPMNMQQQQMYNQQFMNMHYNGPMPTQPFNPDCQQQQQQQVQRSDFKKLEMSPGCNQVTSSTDIVVEARREPEAPPIENFMDNLHSISAENFMDNINSISQENMNQVYSPTAMSNRSTSQASRYTSSIMNTSNMVVNDMNTTMMQLAEENRFFTRRH